MKQTKRHENGFALITTVMLLAVLAAMMGAYVVVSKIELATTKGTKDSVSGFYTSEAGLNIRAEEVRQTFVGYNRPTGSSPTAMNACMGSNIGSGDFVCKNFSFGARTARTYITEAAGNPVVLTIPPGERYQNLNAQEYRYTATSQALNSSDRVQAMLDLRFKSRLVPLFQFAAFYNKDLEILPGPAMSLAGPVHTNGDLYLNAQTSLDIAGQVTARGDVYRGRKDGSVSPSCWSYPVRIMDPLSARALYPTCSSRVKIVKSDTVPYNNMLQMNVEPVTVPGPEIFDPSPSALYWSKADLRLVLHLTAAGAVDTSNSTTGVEIRDTNDTVNTAYTNSLHTCAGNYGGKVIGTSVSTSSDSAPYGFYNFREAKWMKILNVDLRALLDCLHSTNWFASGKKLDDQTEGGLVFHFTVKGPNSTVVNNYGVRISDAASLRSTIGGAPIPKGLTVVSDQAMYVQGNYNSVNKIPAAVMSDSLNVLSPAWLDKNSSKAIASRVASSATINAAFLSGTDSTGGSEGTAGQGGAYNGGLENYLRFHENWSGKTLTYRGSFVSLNTPRHVSGKWGTQSYSPPARDWNYDTSFNNAANLPPITPRFVYLRQELFVRQFEM